MFIRQCIENHFLISNLDKLFLISANITLVLWYIVNSNTVTWDFIETYLCEAQCLKNIFLICPIFGNILAENKPEAWQGWH